MQLILKDVKNRVDRAKAFDVSTNKEIAPAEFPNPQGRFASGEQCVYVLGTTGMMLAHPVNEDFVGKDFYREPWEKPRILRVDKLGCSKKAATVFKRYGGCCPHAPLPTIRRLLQERKGLSG